MTRLVTVAAVQMAMTDDVAARACATAERLVHSAAADGAQIVLIPELFEGRTSSASTSSPSTSPGARPLDGHPTVEHFRAVAAELGVVLPLSIYERAGQATFNTVVVVDADGVVLGTYRKSHIPDGPGYTEKYYFNGGDTGFRVWATACPGHRVGICWTSGSPSRRADMALLGAEVLLGDGHRQQSRPTRRGTPARYHWQLGDAEVVAANLMPLVAANRTVPRWGLPAPPARTASVGRSRYYGSVVHRRQHPAPRWPRPMPTGRR